MAKKRGGSGRNGTSGGGSPPKRDRRPSWERSSYLKNPIAPLDRVMELLGFNQTALAEKIEQAVQQTRISKWLRYEGSPDIAQYEAMCRAMEVGVDLMFDLEPEQITREVIALHKSVRRIIQQIGLAEAERRLYGLPMAAHPQPASAVVEGRPLGSTTIRNLDNGTSSDAGRARRSDKPKTRHR